MFHWKKDQDLREQAQEYATHYDFREIFTEDEAGLRLLALLLTGDLGRAEECLVRGLHKETEDNEAFRDWAHAWSKKAVIKNAIQAVSPAPVQSNGDFNGNPNRSQQTLAGAVARLEAFERFVFIMSLVEGYSVQDCAILLGASPQEVTSAKLHAVEHVASLLPAEEIVQPVDVRLQERIA